MRVICGYCKKSINGKIVHTSLCVKYYADLRYVVDLKSPYCEAKRPHRDVICQKKKRHKGKHRAVIFWE